MSILKNIINNIKPVEHLSLESPQSNYDRLKELTVKWLNGEANESEIKECELRAEMELKQ